MRHSVSLLSLVALGVLSGEAAAYVAPTGATGGPTAGVLEVKAGDAVRPFAIGTNVAPSAQASAWSKFQQAAGGMWNGIWDEVTGVPMIVSGSGIPAPGSVNDAAAAETFTRSFIAAHIAMLAPGASAGDIQLVDNISDGEMRTLGFIQTHKGMKVVDAHLIFEFKNDRLFVFGSTAFPNVSVPSSAIDAPSDTIKSAATGWMADVGRTLVAKTTETVVLPLVRESGIVEYHRVNAVEVTEPNAHGVWTVYVDSASGAQVARKDNVQYATGVLKYKVPVRSPLFGPRVDRPAPLANVTMAGTASKSDNYGNLTWTAAGAASVTTNCTGTLATANNNTSSGTKVTGTVSVADNGEGVWDKSTTATEDSQLTSFISVNVVKEHVARFVPRGQITTWLGASLVVNDNQPQTCNANWNGTSLQFFIAGVSGANNCENTGRITDVVYHEFGHGFHQNVVTGGGSVQGQMGEGVGDTMSASITQEHAMAPGFFVDKPMDGIRDVENTQGWPPPNTEVHAAGLTYGGWMWNLRKNLKAVYGDKEGTWVTDRLFYESIRRATSIPTSYTQAIAADDDDGNLTNGTPNICAIYAAGNAHQLASATTAAQRVPGVGFPTLSGSTVTVKLLGNSFCGTPVDLTSAVAAYTPPGSTTATMVTMAKGATDTYSGALPAQGENTVGTYKVSATLPGGKVYTFPDNPGDPAYQYYSGAVTNLYCTDFEGTTAPADWTHTGTPATADEWEWGTPGEIALTNDPRTAASGTKVFGMDLGKWTTDGVYPASGTSSLTSPMVNTAGKANVRLQYRRQLNVESGASDQATIYANGTKVWSNSTTANHTDKEWRFHDVDLSAQAASGSVQIKFELVANATNNFGGWNIDDFCIVSGQGDGGAPPVPDAGDDAGIRDVSVDIGDGAGGSAGASGAGGTAGTAGASGASGAAGKGGAAGSAGTAGTAGKAGSAGSSGASGSGGVAGSSGAAGTSGTGGASGASGTGGTGGSGGSGATGGSGGAGGSTGDTDGCSCRIGAAPSSRSNSVAWLAALPLVGLALRRRRR